MRFLLVKLFLLLLLFTGICSESFAQSIPFVPPAFNYTTHNYNAGNQNWAIAQGKNRVIYVGNDYGLLSFDGVNWKLNLLPNNLSVKSILVDNSFSEEKIYVGSFEEFGFFQKNEKNELLYYSLKHLIKDFTLYNDEVWTINKLGNLVFFQTFSSYFIYNELDNSLKAEKPYPAPLYFFKAHDNLYAQFINEHFYIFDGVQFQLLLTRDKLNNDHVVSVLPFNNELYLVTTNSGIFSYNPISENLSHRKTAIDNELKSETVNRGVILSDSTFVLGTLNNGLYALKTDGTVLWRLNRDNGLYNNTVLGLFNDEDKNLWATLDNGVSYIQTSSPLSFFEPQHIRIGLVEDILIKDDQFYVATNQGVYTYSNERKDIYQLPDFNVQSWFIRSFGNQIITGNNTGTSFIQKDRKIEIPDASTGGTDIKVMRIHNSDFLLESTYTALQVYFRNTNGQWVYSHKVDNFFDLINQLEQDHAGNIWASHMYKGVYKIRLDVQLKRVLLRDFYPTLDSTVTATKPIRTMKLKGRIVFTNGNAFYTYDDITQKIILYEQLNQQLPQLTDTRNIVSINDTAFWFLRPEEYTLVKITNGKYKISDKIPFGILNNPPNTGRGNMYVDKNNVSYFCLNGGIGKYIPDESFQTNLPTLEISKIWSYNRKNDTPKNLPVNERNVVNYSDNNLTFEFQYPDYSKKKFAVECFLEHYDTRWISTTPDLTITYPNLPANSYILNSRVLNDMGEVLSTVSILFQVKNPWYKTTLSIVIYIILISLLLAFLIRKYIQMVVKRKNKLFAEQEKERIAQLDRQEKIIAEMKSEKLQNELTYKSKELANATMMVINHEELLNKLKSEIQENIRIGRITRSHGSKLVKMIDSNLSGEDEWALFQENFDLIHENFFRKLTEQYPALTPSDLRLCALLRLNYSSKEIAKMLNLTLRGVEAARYRLRKKLNLNEEENLASFIINFK